MGQCGTLPGSPADSPLLELSTNLREDLVAGEVGALNKEKVLVGATVKLREGSLTALLSIATVI